MTGIQIGNKTSKYPIIQGGMGVGVSLHRLAGTVAKEGGIGIISTADIGFNESDFETSPDEANIRALKKEIAMAREISPDGIIGVNIMCACNQYDEIVAESVKNGIDLIISGAGLPLKLPAFVKGTNTKIAPIVSSARAFSLICRQWKRRYDYIPDLVVVEGPKAGGHLGFSYSDLQEHEPRLEDIVREIIKLARDIEQETGKRIQVVAAGGVYTKTDVERYLQIGAAGVQLASRFVATEECDASESFKTAYINCSSEDITIIHSPVGMPGRAIRNAFINKVENCKEKIVHCSQCLKACNPLKAPYCITKALINAVKGDVENGLVFCGSNANKIKEIITVRKLISELF